ncbi:MFS transporter [Kiloniella laminariae]|uniref:MFS transporter n=1 Tax=Kiloniella laminariae TaxID=454162 RepID=A0ABT4LIT9_9PROT|nr:MFS transporter [Kiloniella laminariae]MCZ4281008.1 MFS transporter [Kiloniella laminariae]
MLSVLRHRIYRHLFLAQLLSLIGSGLTTVALGLLAYELAGADAGAVLGTALALKMVAYVGVAPLVGAFADRVPRKAFLVGLDLCRAGMIVFLPFVSEIWQIYLLVFLFQSFSAAFTPTFQATIPDILPEEEDYTKALSLSRLAYDLEALLSPLFASILLIFISFHWLFLGTVFGFLASALLVITVVLPRAQPTEEESSFFRRVSRGSRIYLATPRLRGLLALSFAVSSAGVMVIVNTVVFARNTLSGSEQDVALFLAAAGLGSMLVALTLRSLLESFPPRSVMLCGALVLFLALVAASFQPGYAQALLIWALIGAGGSMVQTPGGLLLKRSARKEDLPGIFATHFALSHACWLITYPAAGWLGRYLGLELTFMIMAGGVLIGGVTALLTWPREDSDVLMHEHPEVSHLHLHTHDEHHHHEHQGWEGPEPHRHPHYHAPHRHAHSFVIDSHHQIWPDRN